MQKNTNKTLSPIAIWRAAAPLNRQKSSMPFGARLHLALFRPLGKIQDFACSGAWGHAAAGFFSTEARPLVKAALASPPLNRIAPPPPPPPPIISSYIIEETLKKARSLIQLFLAKTRKLAVFLAAPLKCKKSAVAKPIFFQKFAFFPLPRFSPPLYPTPYSRSRPYAMFQR